MNEQIGLFRINLSQKRFKRGAFYLSAIMRDAEFVALDGRFYIENSKGLQPTRSGFRVPSEQVEHFKDVFQKDLREIGDIVLFDNNAFRFHVRYVNDKYGEGIDFRKYRTTKKYTGWDRAGLRMKLEDVKAMADWLNGFRANELSQLSGIFSSKDIIKRDNDQDDARDTSRLLVNPIISEIIES